MEYSFTDTLLSLGNISLSFGKDLILRDINLEIRDVQVLGSTMGQINTLLGPSGIGKTQLLKIIAGLVKPTTGEVRVGVDQKISVPGMVGMVLQDYPLFSHYTALGNLTLICKDRERIDYFLHEFDLWQHKDKYVKKLSGGQRQRCAIVQQLLCSEHFTLLDEPFSGLDPKAIDKLCKMLNKIANLHEQNTLFISSHILEPSIAISDHVFMLGNQYEEEPTVPNADGDGLTCAKIPGATIIYEEDLVASGLAWNPDIRKDNRFTQKIEEIRQRFMNT